jgi:hypothetical protein
MKATYTARPGLSVEVEGADQPLLFAQLAAAAEIFGEPCCGLCGSIAIVPTCRTRGTFTFYEWQCTDPACGAKLKIGQRLDKQLFPVRKLTASGQPGDARPGQDHGTTGAHNGWTRYHGPDTENDDDAPPARSANNGRPAPTPSSSAGPKTPARPAAAAPAASTPAPARPAAPAPAPAASTASTAAAAPAGGPYITASQWEEIKAALKANGIGELAYLRRFKVDRPRHIRAAHFAEALDAASQPDDALRELNRQARAAGKE